MNKTTIHNVSTTPQSTLTHSGGRDGLCFEVHRLDSGLSGNVERVTLRCGAKTVEIIPTRGMGISRAENHGVRFGWDSPVAGPVHPTWVPLNEPDGIGWLDGFDEMLVRCGLASNGAPEIDERGKLIWPLHGRIANLPASHFQIDIDESAGRIAFRGVVNETRFHIRHLELQTEIALQADSDEISVTDRVTNRSHRPTSIQMLYHNNFGPPILESGSQLFAPFKRLVPRNANAAAGIKRWNHYAAPDPEFVEQVYFMEMNADEDGKSMVVLANADRSRGVSIRYDSVTLPCFSVWKNTVGVEDGYVTGLEPATNFPNTRGFEASHGRVVALAPGETYEMSLNIGMLVTPSAVDQAIHVVDRIQTGSMEILDEPDPDWCE